MGRRSALNPAIIITNRWLAAAGIIQVASCHRRSRAAETSLPECPAGGEHVSKYEPRLLEQAVANRCAASSNAEACGRIAALVVGRPLDAFAFRRGRVCMCAVSGGARYGNATRRPRTGNTSTCESFWPALCPRTRLTELAKARFKTRRDTVGEL